MRRRDFHEFGDALESHLGACQQGVAAGSWETDLQFWDLLGMFLEEGSYKFGKGRIVVPPDLDFRHLDTTECERDGCFRVDIFQGRPEIEADGKLLSLVMSFTMIRPKLLGIDVATDYRTAYVDISDIPDMTVNLRRP